MKVNVAKQTETEAWAAEAFWHKDTVKLPAFTSLPEPYRRWLTHLYRQQHRGIHTSACRMPSPLFKGTQPFISSSLLPFSPQHTPAATHWSRATVTHCHFHLLPVAIGGLSKLRQELNFRWIECLCVAKDTRSQFVHGSSSRVLRRAPGRDSTCTARSGRPPGPLQAGS